MIPISVDIPSSPIVNPDGSVTQCADAPIGYNVLESHPQSVQTNGTAFTNHVRTEESPNIHFFTTTGEGHVKLMAYPSFDVAHTLKAHTATCLCVKLGPNGRYIATGGSDALITLWDTTDLICQRTLFSDELGTVRALSWSFDGRYVCGACDEAGYGGNGIQIFHAETGESVYTVPTGGGPNSGITDVAWHPTRYWLAYSMTADGPGSASAGGLKIVGAAGGGL